MGKALAETFADARRIFEEADDALGFPLSRLCFEGPDDQLKLTENTQPALLTVSIAAFAVLAGERLDAGFRRRSQPGRILGAGGCGQPAVRRRRAPGAAARPLYAGGRAAGRGRHGRAAQTARGKAGRRSGAAAQGEIVSAANLNSPDQVVIAGHAAAVNRAIELAKAAGARRAVLLPVSAPFHCALMMPAQQRLRVDLDATEFRDLSCPLVNNWQAREIRTRRGSARRTLPAGAQPGALGGIDPPPGRPGRDPFRGSGGRRRADRPLAWHRTVAGGAPVRRAVRTRRIGILSRLVSCFSFTRGSASRRGHPGNFGRPRKMIERYFPVAGRPW